MWLEGAPTLAPLPIWSFPPAPEWRVELGAVVRPRLGCGRPKKSQNTNAKPPLTPPYPSLQRAACIQPQLQISRPVTL